MKWKWRKRLIALVVSVMMMTALPLGGIAAAPSGSGSDNQRSLNIQQSNTTSSQYAQPQTSVVQNTYSGGEQRVVITFKDKVDQTVIEHARGKIKRNHKHLPSVAVTLPSSEVDSLKKNPKVKSVESDIQLKATEQTMDWGVTAVNATYAWNNGNMGNGIKVAVLDSGIDTRHEDLSVAGGASFVDYTSSYDDDFGHGTHVAGIIAAKNNNLGVVGVAPEASLYAIKVIDSHGQGYLSDVIAGIDYAIDNGLNIINLSLATSTDSPALHLAVDQAYNSGLLVVAAAGNSGTIDGQSDTIEYPAKYSSVLSVGAIDSNRNRAPFSATGEKLDLVAPGVGVKSTYLNQGYTSLDGTSMAVPYVVGAASVLWSTYKDSTNIDIKKILLNDAIKIGDQQLYGHGLVNLGKALNLINGQEQLVPLEASVSEYENKQVEIDKTLLGLGSRLLYLSEKAYKENNIESSKTLIQNYYDLLQKNIALHKFSDSNAISSISVQSSVYEVVYNPSYIRDFNNLIQEYESVINQYEPASLKNMNVSTQSISYPSLVLDTPILQDNNITNNFVFTPPSTGVYQFTLEPVDKESEMDIDCNIYSPQGGFIYPSYNSINGKRILDVFLEGGVTYDVEIITNMADPRSIVSITKTPILELNSPTDVSLPDGQFEVFKFTPSRTFYYLISKIGFGGFSPQGSEALISVYKDSNLTNEVISSEDTLNCFLQAGTTYYIKLDKLSEPLHLRLQITTNGTDDQDLLLDIPADLDAQGTDTSILEFIPPTTGDYSIKTDYFNGVNTGDHPSITLISVYDERFYQLFGIGYESVSVHLDGGQSYYVKVKDYMGQYTNQIKVRVVATLRSITDTNVESKVPYDTAKPGLNMSENYKFTSSSSDKYVFWTSPYLGNAAYLNDTILEIYSDPGRSTLIASNDNYNDIQFSRIELDLIAGTSYYISLKSKSGSIETRFMVAQKLDSLVPTNLTATKADNTSVLLSWKSTLNSGYVTGYDIYNGATLAGSVNNSTTTYLITGLAMNTLYTFTVKAKDASGNVLAASNTVNAIIDTQAPTNLAVSGTTSSTITLIWTPSIDNFGVLGYEIYEGSTLKGTVNGATTTFTVTGLTANKLYNFTVKAKYAAGKVSAASNLLKAMIDTQASTAPTNLAVSGTTSSSIALMWNASTDNIEVTGYDIYDGSTLKGTVTGAATSYNVTGLTANTLYNFTVKAKDTAGNASVASNLLKAMIDTQAPIAPSNIAVSGKTNSTITLMWTASNDNVGVTGYDIYEGSTLKGSVDGTTTSYTVTGLAVNTLYNFTVKAKDVAGNSSTASSLFQSMIDTQVPSGPKVVYAYRGSTITDDLSNWPSLLNAKSTSVNGSYKYVLYNDNTIKYTIGSDRNPKTEDPKLWPSLENSKSFSFSSSNSQGHVYVYRYVFYNDNTVKYTVDASLAYPNAVYSENVNVWPSFENAKSMSFGLFGFSNSNSIRTFRYVLYNDNTVKYTENGSTPRTDTTNWPNLTNAKSLSFNWDADNPTRYVGYTDQDPIINVSSNTNQLIYKQSAQNIITISGTASDADNDSVTVSANIAGVTKAVVISNTTSPQNWTLSWNVDSDKIPVGSYSNVSVTARDTLWGTASTSYTGVISVDTLPSAPSNLSPGSKNTLSPSNSTLSPILIWKFNDSDPGDVQNAYQVIVTDSSTGGVIIDTGWMNSNSSTYTVPARTLVRGTTYSWSVRVKDSKGGISVFSTPAFIQPNQLPVVSNASVWQTGDNKFNFSWQYSDPEGQLQSNFQIIGSHDDWITTGYDSGIMTSSSSYFISPVLVGQNWKFRIQVGDGMDWSNQVSIGIIDVTPPTAPSKLKISKYNGNSVDLVWQQATDDVGVAAYDVYDKDIFLATTSASTQTISNLLQDKLYIFNVKARDTSGNISTASNVTYFYTGSHQYIYNAQGRIDYIRLSSGQIIKYQYDSNGNLLDTQLQP